jgi:hypothetical protein
MDSTTTSFLETVIAGQVRHVLTGVAGGLVAHGALTADQSNSFVQIGAGLALYGVGAGWSWWQKNGQALVKARLDKLRHRVQAIPIVTAATPTIAVNSTIIRAKEEAAVPMGAVAVLPVTEDQRS